jgi:hypothetical protein
VGEREWQNLDFDALTDEIPVAEGMGALRMGDLFARVF